MQTVKVTVNLPEELVKRLKEESKKSQTTMTETIRKGLETELFLSKEEEAGSKILLEKKGHKLVHIVRR